MLEEGPLIEADEGAFAPGAEPGSGHPPLGKEIHAVSIGPLGNSHVGNHKCGAML